MTRKFLLLIIGVLGLARLSLAADGAASKTNLVASCAKISAALAADDFTAAKKAASVFAEQANAAGKKNLGDKATPVAKAADIKAARESFKALSTAIEPLAAGEKDFVVMNCPMAGADWVQAQGPVRNPYYGKMMLACGGPKETK